MNDTSLALCFDTDTLPSGIIVVGEDRKIVYTNQYATKLMSDQGASLVGQRIEEVVTLASNLFIDSYVYPLLLESSKADEIQLNFKNISGKGAPAPVVVNIAMTADRSTLWTFARCDDRNKLFDELLSARDSLSEQANELSALNEQLLKERDNLDAIQFELLQTERMAALGRASALVSHELRNPLGAIAASLKLLSLRNKDDQEMQTVVNRLWHNLGRCERMVSSMLDFSKPIKIDCQLIQPNDLIEQVLQDLALPAHVDLDWIPGQCTPVELDIDLMTRALANLLDNAVASMTPPISGRTMRLLIRCDQNDSGLTLEISDTGCGMNRETVARLFEPFFSTKVYGIGIGAVFAHNVVTAHQGQIKVESSTDSGTRTIITLPFN